MGQFLLTLAGVAIVCHARMEGDFGAVLLEPLAAVGPQVIFIISPCTLLNSWTRELRAFSSYNSSLSV